jgi:hypothetical protein
MSSNVVTIRRYLAESTLRSHDFHQIVLPYVGNLELEADGRCGLVKQDLARWLLTRTNLPIAEIAARTGHADQSALTRRLRQALRSTPAALRRSVRSCSQPAERMRASPAEEFE